MNAKHATLGALVFLLGLALWQEVRIRDLQAQLSPPDGDPVRTPVRVAAAPARARPARDTDAPRPPSSSSPAAAAALQELDRAAFEPRAVRLGTAPEAATDEDAPVEPEQIAELVAAEIEKRDEERWERRRRRVIEDAQTAVNEFIELQGLDEEIGQKLATMITAEREQMMEFFRQGRAGEVPFHEVREKIGALRDETDNNVEAILDEDSYAAYQERRDEERGPWRRGGRRGR